MNNPLTDFWQRITNKQGRQPTRSDTAKPTQQRRSPRVEARLPLKVMILGTEFKMDDVRYQPSLTGHTHDLSEIGLGILLPLEHVGELDLSGTYRRIKVVLDLPERRVEIYATAVHSRSGAQQTRGVNRLVGARITKMSPEDGRRLRNYLAHTH